jgi:phosphoglycerate dehydrogenase-like enzyme
MKLILPHYIAERVEPFVPERAPGCQIVHIDNDGKPDGDLADADIFLRWWTAAHIFNAVMAAAPHVRWVHTPSAGVDHLLKSSPEFAQSDILLTNSAGAHSVPIAEFVLMYMLNHVKRSRELYQLLPANAWVFEDREQLDELAGKTLLLIGLGAIGEEIARRAAAFNMRIIGSRRNVAPTAHIDLVVGADAWREYLPQADFVVIAAPLTAATHGMFGATEYARMKPTSYLMNIARGPILQQAALVEALNTGQIAGAAIDVTDPEPPNADDPIWTAKNLWVTPHISYSSPHTWGRSIEIFLDNLERYAKGQPLRNIVDKQAGY